MFLLLISSQLSAQETIFENSNDSLFHENPPLPVIKMKAIVRFNNKAVVKLKVDNLLVGDVVSYVDNDGVVFNTNIVETDSTILLTNLGLNKVYKIVLNNGMPNEYILDDINTFSQQGYPIHLSNVFIQKIETWTSQEETNPSLPILYHYLKDMPELDTYEKLYFFQRMYHDSFQVFPTSSWVGIDDNVNWALLDGIEEWNPNNINPCRCNYVLQIDPKINPGFRDPFNKRNVPDNINHGRQYFDRGSDVYSHLHEIGNGPAQHHKYILRVSRVNVGERSSTSGSALSTVQTPAAQISAAYKSELTFQLLCDRPIYGGALPEACKCEKKVDVFYRYDSKLMADARSLSCFLCDKKGAAVTIEDWTLVSVHQGNTTTVLGAGKGESKANCEDVGAIGMATNIASTAAVFTYSAMAAIATPTPATITAVSTAFQNYMNAALSIFSPNGQTCGTAGTSPPYNTLVDGSRTLTLKTNELMRVVMFNTHLFQTKARRAGEAKAEKISNYYLAATIAQNTTQNEFQYCCSKKVGLYNLGSFNGAPLNLLQTQNELGYYLGLKRPWDAPYNVNNPMSGIIVPHEVDALYGNSGCDMVQVVYNNTRKEDKNTNLKVKFDNNSFAIQNQSIIENSSTTSNQVSNNEIVYYNVNIYDLSGRVLFTKVNVAENEIISFTDNIPFNQTLIINISNQYENKSYKFIR